MFVDHIKIHAKAGNGGNGCVSFRREKYVPKGGPDGGEGGKGADIVLEVSPHLDTLRDFFYKPFLKAKHGGQGEAQNRTGRSGKDLVLPVPPGTMVYRDPREEKSGESEDTQPREREVIDLEAETATDSGDGGKGRTGTRDDPVREMIADLTKPGERFVLAKGGAGGKGNVRFKSSRNQAPEESTPGEEGEEGDFYLELRKIADVGLVGFPNAGKSTLLGKLSAAQPKIAAYPFTTLQPMVGVVDFEGFSRCTVADVPGLIEGAHENRGLGHEFLRHLMRCRILLFVIDAAGSEGRHPVEDLMALRQEVSLYDESLAQKPWLIVANKLDLPEAAENRDLLQSRFPKIEVIGISALEGEAIEDLKGVLQGRAGQRPE